MKTIEERAEKYVWKEWTPECHFIAEESYIAGAKDQQYIDRLFIEQLIDKACEWLKENARDYACATVRCPYGEEEEIICDVHPEIVEGFRKAMEE